MKIAAVVSGAVAALCVLLLAFRAPLLTGLAHAWIVDEPIQPADAILVLGGGAQFRAQEAIRLHQAGYAPVIIIINNELKWTNQLGLSIPESEFMKRILLHQGIPASAMVQVGENITSTYGEALAVREWMVESGAKRLLVPTDPFHTRRARWVFNKTLKPAGATVSVTAIQSDQPQAESWWQREDTLLSFQNEVIKFCFYLVKY